MIPAERPNTGAYLAIEGLSKHYGDVAAVDDLSIGIDEGEMLVLLGPSGCGKTTTMRCIVGLEIPDAGKIVADGRVLFDSEQGITVPANHRGMGMVFQSYAIWPHKTVFENVVFPLRMQSVPKAEARDRVEEMLSLVGLSGLGDRGASQLSGGQMQRVALARSLAMKPKVLLFDEPLSNLDAKLRDKLRFELREIQQQLGITGVYVTHDQAEALALADRIAVMRDGDIMQLAEPVELYRRPRNVFVADFLGSSNILDGVVTYDDSGRVAVELDGGALQLPVGHDVDAPAPGTKVNVSVRPEDIVVHDPAGDHVDDCLQARVRVASFLGSQVRYHVQLEGGPDLYVTSADTTTLIPSGSRVAVEVPAAAVRTFER